VGPYTPWKADPVVERAIQLGRALAERSGETRLPVYLVVHTLEGLANRIALSALSNLLVNSVGANGLASVRLAASFDHVDAPLLWSGTATNANFSFLYVQVQTHQPYAEELVMLPSTKKAEAPRKKSADGSAPRIAERAMEVLKTLAPRHAEVVMILARLQLDALDSRGGDDNADASTNRTTSRAAEYGKKVDPCPRIPYKVFFQECKAACAVNKDALLRVYLAELQDHGLLRFDEDSVSIPFEASKLREFVRRLSAGFEEGDSGG
jgi:hypothetical protein